MKYFQIRFPGSIKELVVTELQYKQHKELFIISEIALMLYIPPEVTLAELREEFGKIFDKGIICSFEHTGRHARGYNPRKNRRGRIFT